MGFGIYGRVIPVIKTSMFQSPGSIALQIGPLAIHWYGIVIGVGIVLCYLYILSELRRRGLTEKPIDDMAFWLVLSGIIGARLYYVAFSWEYFSVYPMEILKIWKGGLAIHGALIAGAITYAIYMWNKKLSWKGYLDIMLPGILLAQGIGRWGNFFNNEAFGTPTSLPWKLFIPEQFRPSQYIDSSYFHPTFLYESLWDIAGFILLAVLSRKWFPKGAGINAKIPNGSIMALYFIWYSFGRFFIESLRTDSLYLGPLRIAQLMSATLFCMGIFLLVFRRPSKSKQ